MFVNPVHPSRTASKRRGLTLIELLVVLVVLAALATMVVPRLSGMASQASAASNATIIADTNTAVQAYASKYKKEPGAWDSLLNTTDAFYSKLSPSLTSLLTVTALDANQASSLTSAGIFGLHDADEARVGMPSDNSSAWRSMANGAEVAMLTLTSTSGGHGTTLIDKALNLNQYNGSFNYDYVAVGLGGPTSVKGTTMSEIPLVVTSSLDPTKTYCRVICVYKIPKAGSTTTFPAQYVGCFLPDGTSQRDSMDKYHQSQVN